MNRVPKLRFKEFNGEWEEKRLYEIAKKITDKNIENKINIVLTNSAEHGIIKQEDFFDKEIANEKNINTYYLVEKNSFVYNPRISKFAPFGPINRNHLECGVVSPLYLVFNINEEYRNFMEKYFKTSYWYKYMYNVGNSGVRSDRMNISNNDFFNMNVFMPNNIQEQEKIADFLSSVDKKISITEEKLNLFKDYKKGIMQKIFNQELRFKDSNSNDYPEWEEKRLGEIIEFLSDYTANGSFASLKENVTYYTEENYAVLVRTTDLEKRIFTPERFTDKKGYNFLKKTALFGGEIILANVGSIGNVYKVPSYNKPMTLAPNTYVIYFNTLVEKEFIYQMMKTNNFKNKILSKVGSSTLKAINKANLKDIDIFIPTSLEEQQKIANFLSSIDNKIENLATELENLKEFKKGLLQQMFV